MGEGWNVRIQQADVSGVRLEEGGSGQVLRSGLIALLAGLINSIGFLSNFFVFEKKKKKSIKYVHNIKVTREKFQKHFFTFSLCFNNFRQRFGTNLIVKNI